MDDGAPARRQRIRDGGAGDGSAPLLTRDEGHTSASSASIRSLGQTQDQ